MLVPIQMLHATSLGVALSEEQRQYESAFKA
jgi:hypothetical protein